MIYTVFLKQIYSWGANHEGQLGTGNKIARPKPTLIPWQPEDGQIVQVECDISTHHSRVLTHHLLVRVIMLLQLSTYPEFIMFNYTRLAITGKVMPNTLRPKQNGHHFPDNIFKCIFINENLRICVQISLTFVPHGAIKTTPLLVQIMAWHRTGDKPLSESKMI